MNRTAIIAKDKYEMAHPAQTNNKHGYSLAGLERIATQCADSQLSAQASFIASAIHNLLNAGSLEQFAAAYKKARLVVHATDIPLMFSLADYRFNQFENYTEEKIVQLENSTEYADEAWIPAYPGKLDNELNSLF